MSDNLYVNMTPLFVDEYLRSSNLLDLIYIACRRLSKIYKIGTYWYLVALLHITDGHFVCHNWEP